MSFNTFRETVSDPTQPISIDFFFSSPAVALGILVVPVFDTLRAFLLRLVSRGSPFHADRRHVHYLLIDLGLSHRQVCLALYGANIFFIVLVIAFQKIGTLNLILIVFTVCILITFILVRIKANKMTADLTEGNERKNAG